MSDVGKRIKDARKRRNISLPKLAKMAGICKGNLSRIENKPCNIGLETLCRIAKALDVRPKDLQP